MQYVSVLDIDFKPLPHPQHNQVFCYQTATTPETHRIVKDNLHLSCHIQETRKGTCTSDQDNLSRFYFVLTGPRYCPSLEAKILRFGNKDRHTVWLEPEGYDSGGPLASLYALYLREIRYRRNIPQWDLVQYARGVTGVNDANNTRPDKCKDGSTCVWRRVRPCGCSRAWAYVFSILPELPEVFWFRLLATLETKRIQVCRVDRCILEKADPRTGTVPCRSNQWWAFSHRDVTFV